jgi:hypothetical protein
MMTDESTAKLTEIDRNLEMFLQLLPSIMNEHEGQYALLRHQALVGYYPSAIDAQIAGNQQFSDRLFSIQEVTEAIAELGHYSYAVS